ncbi:hypothetical protein GCM10011506_43990 [Marivirga lumbricoides]|uniref:Lysozyme inhibitor LprI-like N-terminal domain-containing protein n=1 Tax=Marivirga lumbricoides TaxID=1046115 RepID=A0ABQ1N529_9BACT|nr:hypothetical protein GCM10011506_43990 [Marivirga lumbricoides]
MKFINKLLLCGSIIIIAFSCNNSKSEYANFCDELDAVDLEMNNKVEEIQKKYANKKAFLKRFNSAQIQWIQYKNRHIRAVFPLKKEMYSEQYGKDYNYCKCEELARLTKLRNNELERWLKPSENKENCPASWN